MNKPRDVTVQNFSWFRDLHRRDLLNLDPPYQRRSVWNQSYKDFFVDTVLRFQVLEVRGRGESQLSPTDFVFDSVRMYCRLKGVEGADPSILAAYKFEIQVKSTLEDAWTSLTRHINYKEAVPNWKLQRLSAQFKAVLENVDLQIDAAAAIADGIEPSPWWESEVRGKLHDTISRVVGADTFPQEMAPQNISRIVDGTWKLLKSGGIVELGALRARKFDGLDGVCRLLLEKVPARARQTGPSFTLIQIITGVIFENLRPKSTNQLNSHYVYGLSDLTREFPALRSCGVRDIAL